MVWKRPSNGSAVICTFIALMSMSGKSYIPLCEPHLGGREWDYVKDCLDSGWVSSVGAYVDRFESMLADYTGTAHAVACVNGTSAIHIALIVAGVKPGDEVLIPTLTFIAPVNAIRYAGAWPVLLDVEPTHWQLDISKVALFLENECEQQNGEYRNRRTGRRVKAILPVHILGHPVDMRRLLELTEKTGLRVIEDATESLGALCHGRPVGSLADLGCFSFNGNKLLTTGGGGMIVTNNEAYAKAAKHLTTQAKCSSTEFIHDQVGYNYRLTNVQAAIGCAQMERISFHLERKKQIANRYRQAFANHPKIRLFENAAWAESCEWLFSLRFQDLPENLNVKLLQQELHTRGIGTRPLWQPMHLSPAHADLGRFDCPVADGLYASALSLPCSVGLTEGQQDNVVENLLALLSAS
jgi:perosamine synthetase